MKLFKYNDKIKKFFEKNLNFATILNFDTKIEIL